MSGYLLDANLIAAILVHELDGIITFNRKDFVRYPMIKIITPNDEPAQ